MPEARPVIDDRQSRRIPRRDRKVDLVIVIDRADMNEMRKQGASRVKFLALDQVAVAIAGEARLEVTDVTTTGLRKRVAKPVTLEHAFEP